MRNKILLGSLLVASCLLLVNTAWSVPMMINVQGKLLKDDLPVTAPTTVSFYLSRYISNFDLDYFQKWTITGLTPNKDGIFDQVLSLNSAAEGGILSNDNLYIGIEVGAAHLIPAQPVVSAPFAITAKNLKGGIVDASGEVAVKGKGQVVGGSFESTSGIGVQTTGGDTGVLGVGGSTGVKGYLASDPSTTGRLGYNNYGVYGHAISDDKIAVAGDNSGFAMVGRPIPYYGIGVRGSGKVAIQGIGDIAGGSFESNSTAVRGVGGTNGAYFLGKNGNGVTAISNSGGNGAIGRANGTAGSGVRAEISSTSNNDPALSCNTVGNGPAIDASSSSGMGAEIRGYGGVGIYTYGVQGGIHAVGESTTCGGSFESASGHGVYGVTNSSINYGVFGKNNNTSGIAVAGQNGNNKGYLGYSTRGVWGIATSGTGVYGQTSDVNGAGVYATNNSSPSSARPAALQILNGIIKVSSVIRTIEAGSWTTGTNDLYLTTVAGVINFGSTGSYVDSDGVTHYTTRTIRIHNDYVGPQSVILSNMAYSNVTTGSFDFTVSGTGRISFLTIN